VLEGRDIGTVVFPEADLKIFLTASPEVRATRRFQELQSRGEPVTLEQVLEEQKARDANDSQRQAAPLRQAPDAIRLETDGLSIEQVVAQIVALFHQKVSQN
jgi:cytidylate kinase